MTPLSEFGDLLKQSIGLDVDSIGLSAIERAVQERQSAFNACDRTAHWQRLRGCDAELQALIEAVVVAETWFFRDREAFTTVARIVEMIGVPRALRPHPSDEAATDHEPSDTGRDHLDLDR